MGLQKNIAPFSNWKNGAKLLTISAQKISAVVLECRAVRVMAKSTNTGIIMVGSENVSTDNYTIFLNAHESTDIEVEDVSKVFAIAAVGGEGVNFSYVN